MMLSSAASSVIISVVSSMIQSVASPLSASAARSDIFSSMNFSGVTKHECECPFIRLFISNYRSNIKSYDPEKTEDEKFFHKEPHMRLYSDKIIISQKFCQKYLKNQIKDFEAYIDIIQRRFNSGR